ncbi:MAG: TolC family protein [Bryobacterales bacterium]|nr:TolC family protein [Bryobacterales bacterium]
MIAFPQTPFARRFSKKPLVLSLCGWLLGSWLVLPCGAQAATDGATAARTLSLKECVRIALRQNPDVLLARLDHRESVLRGQRVADPFSLKLGVGSGLAYSSGFPMNVGGSGPSLINAQASMTIFDLPARYRVAEARERAKGDLITEREKQEAAALAIASQFLDAEALTLVERSLHAEIASLERIVAIREQQLKEGRAIPLDVKRAHASLAAARYRLRETDTASHHAQAQLGFLLGLDSGEQVRPSPEERAAPVAPADPASAASEAVGSSAEVKRLEVYLAANRFRAKSAAAVHWPVIRLVSQYSMFSKFNNYDDYYNRFDRHNGQVGASFELPLFNGGAAKAEQSEAGVEAERLRLNLRTAQHRVSLEAADATRRAQDANAYREVAALDLEAAREHVSVVLARVNEGKAKVEELEEARSEENRKWVEYYRSRAAAERAAYDLLHKTGRLLAWFQ